MRLDQQIKEKVRRSLSGRGDAAGFISAWEAAQTVLSHTATCGDDGWWATTGATATESYLLQWAS